VNTHLHSEELSLNTHLCVSGCDVSTCSAPLMHSCTRCSDVVSHTCVGSARAEQARQKWWTTRRIPNTTRLNHHLFKGLPGSACHHYQASPGTRLEWMHVQLSSNQNTLQTNLRQGDPTTVEAELLQSTLW